MSSLSPSFADLLAFLQGQEEGVLPIHPKATSSPLPVFSVMFPANLPVDQEVKGQEQALFPVKLTKQQEFSFSPQGNIRNFHKFTYEGFENVQHSDSVPENLKLCSPTIH